MPASALPQARLPPLPAVLLAAPLLPALPPRTAAALLIPWGSSQGIHVGSSRPEPNPLYDGVKVAELTKEDWDFWLLQPEVRPHLNPIAHLKAFFMIIASSLYLPTCVTMPE